MRNTLSQINYPPATSQPIESRTKLNQEKDKALFIVLLVFANANRGYEEKVAVGDIITGTGLLNEVHTLWTVKSLDLMRRRRRFTLESEIAHFSVLTYFSLRP